MRFIHLVVTRSLCTNSERGRLQDGLDDSCLRHMLEGLSRLQQTRQAKPSTKRSPFPILLDFLACSSICLYFDGANILNGRCLLAQARDATLNLEDPTKVL